MGPWRLYGPVLVFRRLWERLGLEHRRAQGGVKALLRSPVYRRFVHLEGQEVTLARDRVEADARLDGKGVLLTNTALPSDEVALAYKGLWRIEHVFRHLKSSLEVRPVFHWTEGRVRSYVLFCFLALDAALQHRLQEQAPELAYAQVRQALVCLSGRGGKDVDTVAQMGG